MSTKKRFLICALILAFMAALVVFFSCRQKEQKSPKAHKSPNVIFIILDAARADHFSGYGYKKNTTPRMDVISRKGALFLNNFSQATNTHVSVPTYFFSRYFSLPVFPRDVWQIWGIKGETPHTIFRGFDNRQILLSEILSFNGYRTTLFSDQGRFTKETYVVQKFDESYSFCRTEQYASDKEIISSVVSWIKKNKKRKFFIYCHIMSPHAPYPPKEEDGDFINVKDFSGIKKLRTRHRNERDGYAKGWSQKDLTILRGLYDSNLKHTDKWIGALYDSLKKSGLENETLVIITADHGENLGEHNQLIHGGWPWDSVTHVPLIMVYPPLIPPGVRVSGLTESIDIMPTILDICGIELPKNKSMDGISLLKFMENPKMSKAAVFTNNSIRTVEYKYILSRDLLYNLKKDPGETNNIAKQAPLVKRRFKKTFERYMKRYEARFKNARREKPPDFPFYYPIRFFRISPKGAFQECSDKRENAILLKEVSPEKPWLLNMDWLRHGLFCLPANGPPPPITVSAPLPDGVYRVFMLLESPGEIPLLPEITGFRFRFDTRKSFVLPGRIEFVGKHGKVFCYYLDLGETEISEEKFSVQISFHPPDKSSRQAQSAKQSSRSEGPYVIRHIKFVPAGVREKGDAEVPNEEELRRRLESLKSLGYL